MLSLRLDQSWLGKMLCLLALMIGTSVFVPTAQAFQDEEPAAVVEEDTAVEESTTETEEAESVDTEAEAEAEAEEAPYYDKACLLYTSPSPRD